jgi:hypothetical protein
MYENVDIDLAWKYAYIASTICLTAFYMPILPIGAIFSFIGLSIVYFVEKYNVLNMYKRPKKVDENITKLYMENFTLIIFIFALSNYLFMSNEYIGSFKYELLNLILISSLVLVPYGYFIEMFSINKTVNYNYEEEYFEMGINYKMANPITKNKGFREYLDKLLEKGIINQQEHDEYLPKIITAPSDILELYFQKKYSKKTNKYNCFRSLPLNLNTKTTDNQNRKSKVLTGLMDNIYKRSSFSKNQTYDNDSNRFKSSETSIIKQNKSSKLCEDNKSQESFHSDNHIGNSKNEKSDSFNVENRKYD